jgi:hypothetical protein
LGGLPEQAEMNLRPLFKPDGTLSDLLVGPDAEQVQKRTTDCTASTCGRPPGNIFISIDGL